MLAYVFKIVRLKYNSKQIKNKLTLLPYYVILVFLLFFAVFVTVQELWRAIDWDDFG